MIIIKHSFPIQVAHTTRLLLLLPAIFTSGATALTCSILVLKATICKISIVQNKTGKMGILR